MFKHILLPTDGSQASDAAVRTCLRFAKEIGAMVTGLHVVPEFHVFTYKPDMLEDTPEEYAREAAEQARRYLLAIEQGARELGVPYGTLHVMSDDVHETIIQTAISRQCDLIAMASHGRKGIRGLLLGSETQKVLTHSRIPVLVLR